MAAINADQRKAFDKFVSELRGRFNSLSREDYEERKAREDEFERAMNAKLDRAKLVEVQKRLKTEQYGVEQQIEELDRKVSAAWRAHESESDRKREKETLRFDAIVADVLTADDSEKAQVALQKLVTLIESVC